ncbi:MAG: hypothetical protein WKF36_04610 [Candidatus Nitrosocosmicus sp.]
MLFGDCCPAWVLVLFGDCCQQVLVLFGDCCQRVLVLFGDCCPGEIKLLIAPPIWSNMFCALAVCIIGIKNIENSMTVMYFVINTIIIMDNDLNFVLVKKPIIKAE